MSLAAIATDVFGVLSAAWTFVSGNVLLMGICAAPFVVGIVGALMSIFHRR